MQYLKKIASEDNLYQAFRHVKANRGGPGVDRVTLEDFAKEQNSYVQKISQHLLAGSYSFQPTLKITMAKGRQVSILTVPDRVVVQAIHQVLNPLLEKFFHPANYSYRPGRSAIQASLDLEQKLQPGNFPWVLRCDIYRFFDQVDQAILQQLLETSLSHQASASIALVLQSLQIPELTDGQLEKRIKGIPQGSSLSPVLSNLYLTPFDRYLEKAGFCHFRFCDDLTVLLPAREQAEPLLEHVNHFLNEHLKLQLHPQKTHVTSYQEGFDFLGFHFSPQGRKPSKRAKENLRKKLAQSNQAEEQQQTIRGWQAYYGKNELATQDTPFIKLFANLFRGNPQAFARSYQKKGQRYSYQTLRRPLTSEDLIEHFLGKQTLGMYLLDKQQLYCSCIDIDISKKILTQYSHWQELAIYIDRALQYTRKIQRLLQQQNLQPLVEDSGYRGYHLWLFHQPPTQASTVILFWNKILELVGPPEKGIKAEVFPRETNGIQKLGSLIKLPLGLHPHTQRRAIFIDNTGEPISHPHELLTKVIKVPESQLVRIAQQASPPNTNKVQKLLQGCNVIRHLCEKAKQQKDLGHFERLILLYTLGQLGKEGEQALHQVISHCYNYSKKYTQKQINKKYPTPISCQRIHEILGAELNNIEYCCTCELPHNGYHSPVLHVDSQATTNLSRRKQ